MKYLAKKDTIYTMTKYERKTVGRLRKISILKSLPFSEWTVWELEDFINEYEIFYWFNKSNGNIVSPYQFLNNGIYEEKSVYEKYKSNSLKPYIPNPNYKRNVKLKIVYNSLDE